MLDRGLQSGTGSTDLLIGAFKFGALGERVDWFSQGLLQLPIAHDSGFRPSAGANLTAGVRYRGLAGVVPQAQLNARIEGRESGSQADQPNSGSTIVDFSPGVSVPVGDKTSLYAFGQLPVYQRVNGLQLEPRWSASVGMHVAF